MKILEETIRLFQELFIDSNGNMSGVAQGIFATAICSIVVFIFRVIRGKTFTKIAWISNSEREKYLTFCISKSMIGAITEFVILLIAYIISVFLMACLYKEDLINQVETSYKLDVLICTFIIIIILNVVYSKISNKILVEKLSISLKSKWISILSSSYLAFAVLSMSLLLEIFLEPNSKLINILQYSYWVWYVCMIIIGMELIYTTFKYDRPNISKPKVTHTCLSDYDDQHKKFIIENISRNNYYITNDSLVIVNDSRIYEIPKSKIDIEYEYSYNQFKNFFFPELLYKFIGKIKKK